jgi:hypothetical protein
MKSGRASLEVVVSEERMNALHHVYRVMCKKHICVLYDCITPNDNLHENQILKVEMKLLDEVTCKQRLFVFINNIH